MVREERIGMGLGNGTAAACGDRDADRPIRGTAGAAGIWPATDHGLGLGGRRLLALMPLHAITAHFGEARLRERFAIETASFPDAERDRIGQVLDLASRLHAADRRQREPYLC